MPDSTPGQRFLQLIQHLGISKNAFALSLDRTATVIQHLVDERNKPGWDLTCKIFEVYPNVSKDWLLLGEGPMLLSGAGATAAAPAQPLDTAATPSFPAPLFAVSSARPAALAASAPVPAEAEPPAAPQVAAPQSPPAAPAQVASEVASIAPQPEVAATATAPAPGSVALAAPPAALDAATLTAALHAQYLQHQLALAEQRNQHLLEQQKLILERQTLMQQMLDLMRRPA